MSEQEKEEINWLDRFWNPLVRMKWNAETRVEPAHKEDGQNIGYRIFPDGTRDQFIVN